MPPSYKYKLLLEYDGTQYSGWQAQKNALSIQGKITEAAKQIFHGAVDVQGAGRTDAGVHALGQVAHLEVQKKFAVKNILHGLNDLLPKDICVLSVEETSMRFHARHNAVSRRYAYVISQRKTAFAKKYVWWVKDELDVKKMITSATIFEGFHDFQSFADKRLDKNVSSKVSVDESKISLHGDIILYHVTGSHFLWKMVRRMVGVLVEVGRGNLSSRDVSALLDEFSELPSQFTAPPSGLFLEQVFYAGETAKKSDVNVLSFFNLMR